MRTLGLVTARGGSKGVPRKNIRRLGGKPLLAWTADAAREARTLARVVCSTDDSEIADVARAAGLDVPFIRPPDLALDTTPTLPVLQHAVRWLEEQGDRFDAICLLQPTSPLRTATDIDACIELLARSGADSVVSIAPVPAEYNPHWVYFAGGDGELRLATGETTPIPRRQDLPPAFHRDGSIFAMRRDVLMERNSLYGERLVGHISDPASALDIDTLEDWERAEKILATRSSSAS
jgi:CMP-N,N'-diacetyllegionaminic acid synthase